MSQSFKRGEIDPIVALTALQLGMQHRRRNPIPPTPEQIAAKAIRDERAAWNREVEQRKAVKLQAKVNRRSRVQGGNTNDNPTEIPSEIPAGKTCKEPNE